MSELISALRAQVMFEFECPKCGAANLLPAAASSTGGGTFSCRTCSESLVITCGVTPAPASGALELLDLALGKLLREFVPLMTQLGSCQLDLHVRQAMAGELVRSAPRGPQPSSPPPPPIAQPLEQETPEPLASAVNPCPLPLQHRPTDIEVRATVLTQYSRGSDLRIEEIKKLLKADPSNRNLRDYLAFAYYKNDLIENAVPYYVGILRDAPDDVNAQFYLANCYFKRGYLDAARKGWERVVALSPESILGRKARARMVEVGKTG